MKKITLAIAFLALGAQAQTFPSPYCDIPELENPWGVEEISTVSFAGTSISNSDIFSVLVDETATIVNVAPDETYSITITGNTYGDFDANIVAFIDWNQNDILDDAGEVYELGLLSNTDGADGISISLDISVPTDAVLGETRIRITKTYTDQGTEINPPSTAIVDPCGIIFDAFGEGTQESYGQALDFTLNLAPLSVNQFEISALRVYPNPVQDILNIDYKSELTGVKIYNLLGQEVLNRTTASSQLKLDISEITSGMYIVELFSEEGEYSFRVVKN
ncbi:T9SS type A sorting domain-containing protein [Winogradskyella thalassocola]|uniref:Por secretion system C-terminal sorting domain-containing protein n=1 Tax=Winogradskyella thalassocola TaxID=262004 RepID=A0A1G8GC17_9FLAO|nr:T9SS type A sorting domain-containing protein [Winogradskyella thalassocola]SDH91938.1 Por secretion system C-terminal sorting domain-containing protein [Winogradskyella thalassocola]